METTPMGEFRPCCLANEPIPNLNISKGDTLKDAFESDYMEDLRQQFLQGKQPETCSKCWSLEDSGGTSKRMISNSKFGLNTSHKQIKFLDLKLGNICNLKCRICGGWSSSKWANEEIKQGSDIAKYWIKQGQWPRQETKLWQEITDMLPNIDYFEFTGGEPFLIQEHYDILTASVEKGTSKHQQIHYNTNGTTFPAHALDNIWPYFREVEIAFSIDDIAERFEYQRHGAVWQEVNDNVERISSYKNKFNLKTQICCTINIQNIYNLDVMAEWIAQQNFDFVFFNYLQEDKVWNVQNLPEECKHKIQQKLDAYTGAYQQDVRQAVRYMTSTDGFSPELHKRLIRKVTDSDKFRSENFETVFPEYTGLIYD
jgi:MoaA/NifB/PqqE/SkfB family radical SAM enzyme